MSLQPTEALSVTPGDRIGDYVVTAVIADGRMSVICDARHVHLKRRRVALKILRPELVEETGTLSRFVREARIVSQLRHAGIPQIMGFYELLDREPPLYVMAMELLQGRDLHQHLNAVGPLDAPEAVAIAAQVADALGALHDVQVLHRDLKPANIFLAPTRRGELVAKLLDFGVSKGTAERHATTLTAPGTVPGTPEFMAPEQLVGDKLDERTDIYGLGAVLYQVLSGQLPYGRVADYPSYMEFWVQVVHDSLQPLGERRALSGRPPIPPALESLVMRCMAKDPQQRFRDVVQLREALLASVQ